MSRPIEPSLRTLPQTPASAVSPSPPRRQPADQRGLFPLLRFLKCTVREIQPAKVRDAFAEHQFAVFVNAVLHGVAVELLFDAPCQPLPRVRLDAVRMRQVLVNLGGNAVKFTERGEVTVRVAVLGTERGLLKLRIAVADTGPGGTPIVLKPACVRHRAPLAG